MKDNSPPSLTRENGINMNPEIELPRELELRLMKILSEDIDSRLKDLTYLVALQESELTYLWAVVLTLGIYIVIKEHKND